MWLMLTRAPSCPSGWDLTQDPHPRCGCSEQRAVLTPQATPHKPQCQMQDAVASP